MYEPRIYRNQFNTGRFRSFQLAYRETDLWIGTDPESFTPAMAETAKNKVVELWEKLENYIASDPGFAISLVPYKVKPGAPPEAIEMAAAASRAGVGPMAAVAGMFSEEVGKELLLKFPVSELVVENGGDIFMILRNDLWLSVFAGNSPLSEKIAFKVTEADTPAGICTSSGTVGPSLSFGKADAAMVACKSTSLADAFATAFGNKVKSDSVIEDVLNESGNFPEILSIIVICGDKTGIRGNFEVRFI